MTPRITFIINIASFGTRYCTPDEAAVAISDMPPDKLAGSIDSILVFV